VPGLMSVVVMSLPVRLVPRKVYTHTKRHSEEREGEEWIQVACGESCIGGCST
jgi:hypothetical protein